MLFLQLPRDELRILRSRGTGKEEVEPRKSLLKKSLLAVGIKEMSKSKPVKTLKSYSQIANEDILVVVLGAGGRLEGPWRWMK